MQRTALFALISAVTFAAMAAAPASAQTANQRVETRIEFADLDLNSNAGADALLYRFRAAAEDACGDRFGQMTLREHLNIRACKREFMRDAVREARNPSVAARYAERGGRPEAIVLASR